MTVTSVELEEMQKTLTLLTMFHFSQMVDPQDSINYSISIYIFLSNILCICEIINYKKILKVQKLENDI